MKKQQTAGSKKVIYLFCSLLFAFALFYSCSTEKNALLNKAFHYTTTKFNGYYHGKEALKLAKKNLEKAHVDNYEEILSVYRYGSKEQAQGELTNLNRAIGKATKMIENHSMKFKVKGVEQQANNMIDDCYFLLGQARFFKAQYDSTQRTYKFLLTNFKKGKLYYPVSFELIKTYIAQKNFVDAETKIKFLMEDKEFPKKHLANFEELKAHYYLSTNNPTEAIKALEKTIVLSKSSKQKTRLSYILAQLYSKENNQKRASELYDYVAKKSLSYEMAFHAKLNSALTFSSKEKGKITSVLNKMLKDKKNKDFQDQIYYVLAQVFEKNGNMEQAIVNYKKSAASSTNNPKQKAISYLAIADYYFKIPNYINAQAFYDSSLVSLPETHSNYEEIVNKASSLTDLVTNINIVHREDSLQKIAGLSESERQKVIDAQIKEVENKEELAAIAEKAKLEKIKAAAATQLNVGGWLFDNPSLLASANAEFIAIYGNRKLEDNWRRSNKTTTIVNDVQEIVNSNMDEYGNEKIAENKTTNFYLKDLPFTEEAVAESNEKIKKALYKTAIIFKDKLNDIAKSNEYFEELNRRFPENENRPIALYQLYRNYETSNNPDKAAMAKSQILADYPNSEYAQLIKNPNKGAEEEINKQQLAEYYQKIFAVYQSGNYQEVITQIGAINQQYKANPMQGNYDLLNAFAMGKLQGKEAFETELKRVYQVHSGTQVATEVQAILDQIQAERMTAAGKEKMSLEQEKKYQLKLEEAHKFILIYSPDIVKTDELLKQINGIITAENGTDSLQLSTESWGEKETILTVSGFSDQKTAQKFEKKLKLELLDVMRNLGQQYFIISETNFHKFYRFKEVEKYLNFYRENYPK